MSGVTLILAALVPKLGIGAGGTMPWKLAKEMKYFRQVTTGNTVIMGRKTWDSIPAKFRPLKDRHNIVVTRGGASDSFEGAEVASSLDDAIAKAATGDKVFVMGGAQLYTSALWHPETRRVLLTEVRAVGDEPECDTFFDAFPWTPAGVDKSQETGWKRLDQSSLREFVGPNVELPSSPIEENGFVYEFTLWERVPVVNP